MIFKVNIDEWIKETEKEKEANPLFADSRILLWLFLSDSHWRIRMFLDMWIVKQKDRQNDKLQILPKVHASGDKSDISARNERSGHYRRI